MTNWKRVTSQKLIERELFLVEKHGHSLEAAAARASKTGGSLILNRPTYF